MDGSRSSNHVLAFYFNRLQSKRKKKEEEEEMVWDENICINNTNWKNFSEQEFVCCFFMPNGRPTLHIHTLLIEQGTLTDPHDST